MRIIALFLFLIITLVGHTQEDSKLEILHADEVVMDPDISDAQRMLGNVRFKYNDALMFCDSAYRFPNGDFAAYSNVRVNQGDTLQLYGDQLNIFKESQVAKLRNNIRLRDKDMTLKTDILDYDFQKEIATYFGGGVITSGKNNDRLSSETGFYDPKTEYFQFRDNVELKNPDYKVKSDTLRYSSKGYRAYFYGPTPINFEDSEIYCENGWYDSQSEICQFNENAVIRSGSTFMEGDSIYYNGKTGLGEVFENVQIQDTTSNYLILGDYGWHQEKESRSMVTGSAEMIQFFDADSLFLHADTLLALPDSTGEQEIFAYRHVKFYKQDLQGKCDSLTYSKTDSLLSMFGSPILWSKQNQISGRKMDISMNNGKIDQLYIDAESFIISEADSTRYNQIKGKETRGYFTENQLTSVHIFGNGQIIYYPTEEDEEGVNVIGLNRVDCSDVILSIDQSEITKVALMNKPSGGMHPLSKVKEEDLLLEDFFWDIISRPLSRPDIFTW
ncbi:MAG: hypothetical protein HRT74_07400 [Flavobacteriales bacterium]|nr:hypothetical protein [Flavobacteriales bacterium]